MVVALVLATYHQSAAQPPVVPHASGITLIDVAPIAPPVQRPHKNPVRHDPPLPPRVDAPAIVKIVQSPPVEAQTVNAAFAVGAACDLTEAVQAALQADPQVQKQISDIPPERRSVANAVALWNQAWVPISGTPTGKDATPVRDTVVRVVEASPADCRSQVQAGPRLIYLADASGQTVVFALGSGQWTWQQVTQTAANPPVTDQPGREQQASAQAITTLVTRSALPISAGSQSMSLRLAGLNLPAIRRARN